MSRFVIFSNCKKYIISNPTVVAGGANYRSWGRAEPTAPGPARDIFKSQAQARPGLRDSNHARRRPGPASEFPISLVVCPAWPVAFLRIFSLFLRAVSPRGFEATTCSLVRAQRLVWEVARCPQSAYEAEPVMPLHRVSLVPRGLRSALIRHIYRAETCRES